MRAIPKPKEKSGGGAGWIVTFADLMSLLLTFFILLLSFSEMDVQKYQVMAIAMASSFGVSALSGENTVGGSIIFAENPPAPTSTADTDIESELEKEFEEFGNSDVEMVEDPKEPAPENEVDQNVEELTENLVDALEAEILSDALTVSYDADKVVVRFSEATTFPSGSEELKDEMFPILEKIEAVLANCKGDVIVSGYTDNLPVNSSRYRSNWDLSAARAVSVVHQLIFNNKMNADRVIAAGRAETNPLVANDTAANRAKNRRVEINVLDPKCENNDSWAF